MRCGIKKPNINYIRRFGCVAYLLNKEGQRKKFEPKAIKGIFVDYATNNTYRVYVPKIGKIKSNCNVKFDESRNGYELLSENNEESLMKDRNLVILR